LSLQVNPLEHAGEFILTKLISLEVLLELDQVIFVVNCFLSFLGNDLWFYDLFNDQWAWIRGSSTTSASGFAAAKFIEDPSNTPGAKVQVSYTNLWSDILVVGFGGVFGGAGREYSTLRILIL
jgi:hypothetical protein